MLIDMTAPLDSLDLRGSRSWRFRGRRQERMGATRRKFPHAHDEPALRRKLGLIRIVIELTAVLPKLRIKPYCICVTPPQQYVNRVCLPHIIQFEI
ncbi:hypothetical protein ABWH89_17820 [Hoeflea alexandrii]|uniref:hypothetical protein n=1 Tax=Hoeflea alexandrii TaxID=288436 RepID=UPI0035CFC66F